MASALHPSHSAHVSSLSFSRPGGDVASFNNSFTSPLSSHHHTNPYSHAPAHSLGSAHQAPSSFRQSFDETESRRSATSGDEPQIYTAAYSGVPVYEMEVQGVAVMRRRADSWLNATQILKVAGVEKGKRTKILEKEILIGQYEKIQGGYGRYQGTWISYQRGRQFCKEYGVEDALRPLLDYDIKSDGTGTSAFNDTPTKEQAMAANKRKFFSSSMDGKVNGQGSRNTFFQNIGPAASTALAAMNKAARYDSPLPRAGNSQRKGSGMIHRQSSQQAFSQDTAFNGNSQQSDQSFVEQMNLDVSHNSAYGTTRGGISQRMPDTRLNEQEPPRKKIRTSFESDPYLDPNLQDDDRTEMADSFSQQHQQMQFPHEGIPTASLPPLPTPDDRVGEEKQRNLLDLFSESSRVDFSSHPVILHYSGHDLDIPIDPKANTALHWAAMLGRVNVVKALVNKGANIFRGNAGGENPLMQAVSVTNTYDQNCFSETLEYLGPLIEVRDAQGRTVLHHIAVASGIKGRMTSSRYYLESLLEFVVRKGGFNESSQPTSGPKVVSLARLMSDIVNIQDKSGNTALNLVARIGSHAIINQLQEIGADFGIANHKGFRPESFGIFPNPASGGYNAGSQQQSQGLSESQGQGSSQQSLSEADIKPSLSQIEQIKDEIVATTNSILSTTHSNHLNERARLDATLSTQNSDLARLATQHTSYITQVAELKARAKARRENAIKLQNLQFLSSQLRQRQAPQTTATSKIDTLVIDPALLDPEASGTAVTAESTVPSTAHLRVLLSSREQQNAELTGTLQKLKELQSDELEAMYRRVVSLCTGVTEEEVERDLPELVGFVEAGGL